MSRRRIGRICYRGGDQLYKIFIESFLRFVLFWLQIYAAFVPLKRKRVWMRRGKAFFLPKDHPSAATWSKKNSNSLHFAGYLVRKKKFAESSALDKPVKFIVVLHVCSHTCNGEQNFKKEVFRKGKIKLWKLIPQNNESQKKF